MAARPRPLKIEAAYAAIDIAYLARKVEPWHGSAFHGLQSNFR
jgi:hypothetical protein